MLAILLIWLYIFIVTSVAGLLLKFSLFNTSKFQESPIILSVTGYCLITGLLSIISLFFKISLEANVFILLLEILGIVFYKKQFIESFNIYLSKLKSLTSRQYLVFFVVVFNVLLLNIKSVHTDSDTGLYHAQAIQWIEKYPVVPGLANLFANYGFNSSSFISDAFFSFTFIHNFSYFALNSFFVLILVLFGISNIKKEDNNYLIYIILIILNYFYYRGDMSLPFPDILISCTETFIFFVFLEKIKEKSLNQFDFKSVAITFLSLTCITGKLSALPVILSLLLVIIYSFSNLKMKQWLIIFSTGFFIVVPWLIRNIITSGYLIFPYPSIDLFNVDWKVPLSEALIAKSWIVSHARVFVQMDVFNMSFAEWFPIWLRNQNKIDLLLLLISISGMSLFFITTLLSKPIRKKLSRLFFILD